LHDGKIIDQSKSLTHAGRLKQQIYRQIDANPTFVCVIELIIKQTWQMGKISLNR